MKFKDVICDFKLLQELKGEWKSCHDTNIAYDVGIKVLELSNTLNEDRKVGSKVMFMKMAPNTYINEISQHTLVCIWLIQ